MRTTLTLALAVSIITARGADVSAELETIREKNGVPALAAAIIRDGEIVAIGATGLRHIGSDERVTVEDKWHLGSCTKSMTASLAAMAVEEGKLTWTQSLGTTLAKLEPAMDAGWNAVTLEQLLSHRGGAPGNAPSKLWLEASKQQGTVAEQRLTFVRGLLQTAPVSAPGEKHTYSNQGYVMAGAMISVATGKGWEDLIKTRLFAPLKLTSAGFGPQATPDAPQHPWGHTKGLLGYKAVPPGPRADNPPAIGPAGTVHMSIGDFARYAGWHAQQSSLLKPESFAKLHTPVGDGYALGWGVTERPWAGGTALSHNGSNTMNYAVMWVAPAKKLAIVATCNAAGDAAEKAVDDACGLLIQQYVK